MPLKTQPSAISTIERLSSALGVKSDVELAKKMGVAAQTIATWKQRNKVPYDKIVEIAAQRELSLDQLIWGNEHNSSTAAYALEIDSEIAEEVVQNLRVNMLQYFKDPASAAAIRLFLTVYNQVCHLDSGSSRALSIRKAVAMLLLNMHKDFLGSIGEISPKDLTNEQRQELTNSVIRGKDKIMDKFGLSEDDVSVQQSISGKGHQTTGRDITHKGKRKK